MEGAEGGEEGEGKGGGEDCGCDDGEEGDCGVVVLG